MIDLWWQENIANTVRAESFSNFPVPVWRLGDIFQRLKLWQHLYAHLPWRKRTWTAQNWVISFSIVYSCFVFCCRCWSTETYAQFFLTIFLMLIRAKSNEKMWRPETNLITKKKGKNSVENSMKLLFFSLLALKLECCWPFHFNIFSFFLVI